MRYRLDTNKYGRPINALISLDELRARAPGQTFEVHADEIHDEDGDVVATFPKYCTQNDGDCEICTLAVFGKDCADNWVTWKITV